MVYLISSVGVGGCHCSLDNACQSNHTHFPHMHLSFSELILIGFVPNSSSMTFTKGAKQFVVQEALLQAVEFCRLAIYHMQ